MRDKALPGFMVAVNKRSKVYKVQRDLWSGNHGRKSLVKTVRKTLGPTDKISLRNARHQAIQLLEEIENGVDPNAEITDLAAESWTVERLYEEYAEDMRARECGERTIADVGLRVDRYLADWKHIPIGQIKRSMCRERHRKITHKNGKIAANLTLREFRAAYNIALRVADDADALPDNPVKAVTFNRERSANRLIMPDDLPDWWQKLTALQNPVRRAMHELGIFSGLRPGTLVSLEREWVNLTERAIIIPKMKTGRSFALPLSDHMIGIVLKALEMSESFFPDTRWIFPSYSNKTGKVIAVAVWREKALPSETGHILRHTYRTVAQRLKIDPIDRRLLLDHKVPGIDGVYVHEKALFDKLLEEQKMVSDELLRLMGRQGT